MDLVLPTPHDRPAQATQQQQQRDNSSSSSGSDSSSSSSTTTATSTPAFAVHNSVTYAWEGNYEFKNGTLNTHARINRSLVDVEKDGFNNLEEFLPVSSRVWLPFPT